MWFRPELLRQTNPPWHALQALDCTGACVAAVRAAGLHRYIDFLPVSAAHVFSQEHGTLPQVLDGPAAVHSLSLIHI